MQRHPQGPWQPWDYAGGSGDDFPNNYESFFGNSMEQAFHSQVQLLHHQQLARTTESKPRLSKEEVEILENEFQKNHKPSTIIKKTLADSMRVDGARINNWFQNRRAREKKENNIRQYEARQKLEREQSDPNSVSNDGDRTSEAVASTAPFLGRRDASDSPTSSADRSGNSPKDESSDDMSGLPSPIGISRRLPSLVRASTQSEDGEQCEAVPPFMAPSDRHSNCNSMGLSDSATLEQVNGQLPDYFGTYTTKYDCGFETDANVMTDHSGAHQLPNYSLAEYLSSCGSSPHAPLDAHGMLSKSPASLDIASRRNRRPPTLAISGFRSYSNGIPETAADFDDQHGLRTAMRRVASTTAPRSPFLERPHEALLHLNRSPGVAGPRGTAAPPTPNTPMIGHPHGGFIHGYPPSLTAGDKFSSAVHDPTLRTPPSTPGVGDAIHMSMSHGGLIPPSISQFSGDFHVPNLQMPVPEYLQDGACSSSRPASPLYISQAGSNYPGFAGGTAEYIWSDASPSEPVSMGRMNRAVA